MEKRRWKTYRKADKKEPKDKRRLLTLRSNSVGSKSKEVNKGKAKKHQSLAARGKKLLTWISLKHLGMTAEKSSNLLE